jgi:hypothetical protein
MKVYCENCKWLKTTVARNLNCFHPKNIEIDDTALSQRKYAKEDYDDKNYNNDCKDYTQKWYIFWI